MDDFASQIWALWSREAKKTLERKGKRKDGQGSQVKNLWRMGDKVRECSVALV